jgi:6-phosphogluconolactonase
MPRRRFNIDPTDRGEAYGLEPEAMPPPALPGEVIVERDIDLLIDRLAAEMVAAGIAAVRRFGDFHLALSGGSTPQPLYERLMYDPNCRALPWRRTHLWIVDERCVPLEEPQSNFRMIRETIVDHADIPPEQVHPIAATAERAAEEYEGLLKEKLGWRERGEDRLDFILLGMGVDGHTASLFPRSEALHEEVRWVVRVTHAAAQPPERITMTFPMINAARSIAVLATGPAKAATIQRLAAGRDSIDDLPVKGVRPEGGRGELTWYLDAAAAGE